MKFSHLLLDEKDLIDVVQGAIFEFTVTLVVTSRIMLRPIVVFILAVVAELELCLVIISIIYDITALNIFVFLGLLLLLFLSLLDLEVKTNFAHLHDCLHNYLGLCNDFLGWWFITLKDQTTEANE